MNPRQPHLIYEFGDFELDALRRVVVLRASGQQLAVTGRAFEALLYLVERPGRLVDKKALIEALWPHVVVEEGNLSQTIHMLRRALGEQPGEHRYIVTVPGRGYKFVAQVNVRTASIEQSSAPATTSQAETAPAPSRWSKTASAGSAAALTLLIVIGLLIFRSREQRIDETAAQTEPSIAVLPFVDMSEEQDQEHFADGLAEEILNLLAQSDGLRVIARTSSFSFKKQNVDIGTIAQRLAVTHVLEGSVRKSGDRVRITAQLIDGATSAHVWSETYDRGVQDIFGVQRQIASAVAHALHITLRRGGPKRAETSSTQAYDSYLQGRYFFNRRSGSDLLRAKAYFEQAVRIDPDYARAWAGLAGVYYVARFEGPGLPDAQSNWREAAQRAVALAPDLAEANVRAAQYYWHAGDSHAANVHIARAIAIDPDDALVLGIALYRAVMDGRLDDGVELVRRMVAIDPLSAVHRSNLGSFLMLAGRLDEARAELERALELSPASLNVREDIAYVLILQGQTAEALKAIQQLPGYHRDRCLAIVHFVRGDVVEGDAMLARLLALAQAPDSDWEVALAIAQVYAVKNDPDHAFEWLERTHRGLESEGAPLPNRLMKQKLQTTPFLKPLHADPRWGELLATIDKH